MTTRKFKDRSGCELGPFIEYDEILFPILPITTPIEQHFNNIANLEIRSDDVLISAYPKSGTHWVWEMVRMLISGSPKHTTDSKECQMLEFTETGIIDKRPSPRLLNTHLSVKHLPKQIFTKTTKIVYVYRNPKDVVVSLYCHITGIKRTNGYEGKFQDLIDLFLREKVAFGKWGDYIKEWEDILDKGETPIIAIAYEDMKKVGDWKNWITVADNDRFDEFIETKMKESDMKFIYTL
ncbi:sulfotransferase 1B1 [Patella vulgata]|uniref:sulfotransferase 1B1 n=1 Tax=Patella vulgata TaxID=6465 RepID=UPI0024A862FB|nr:sulfotransferase 1B1 [Patella vulgata]